MIACDSGVGGDLSGYNPSPILPYCCLFPPCTDAPLRIESLGRIERVCARLVYSPWDIHIGLDQANSPSACSTRA